MRNPILEQWLNNLGIHFVYHPSIPMSSIDRIRSLQNQARIFDPLTETRVHSLLMALKAGADLPAPLGWEDGLRVLIDGNNRDAAKVRFGAQTTDFYEVFCSAEERQELIATANLILNGDPPSEQDRDAHYVSLVSGGRSVEYVAGKCQVTTRRVREAVATADAQARANRLGSKTDWAKLPNKTIRLELSRGFSDDTVFVKAVELARRFELGRDDVRALRSGTESFGAEFDRLNFLEQEGRRFEQVAKDAKAKKQGKKHVSNPTTVIRMHTGYITRGALLRDLESVLPSYTHEETKNLLGEVEESIQGLQEAAERIRTFK